MAKEEKKAPKLRFNGYTNDWERKKLGDVAEKVIQKNNNNAFKNVLTNSAEYGIISQRDFFERNIANKNNISTYYIVQNDDFVYNPRISNLAPYGPINRNKTGYTGIISPLYYVFRVLNINTAFIEWYFKTTCWHKFMYQHGDSGARSDRFSIKDNELKKLPIKLPADDMEQEKIAKTLTSLDNTLQLHERKCEELALIKQALLQKLFPKKDEVIPEVRYKSFSAAWEQRKLGEIGKVFTGNTPSTKNTENWTTDKSIGHVWITPTDINNNIMFDSERYLSDKGWSQARVVPKNSVLITSIASIGKNAINGVEVAFNQQINALVVQKNNPYFILTLMNKEKQRFESLAGQTATPIINKSTFSSFMVKIPSETEQEQIGEFFKQLDSLIALHQRKLEKLKQLKKFLLQNMFI
ncbi:MAG TPA: restriction endonuclease subunit S [Mammaliicoccus lentus]|nr:restriction endonuclease subunit S [Mammaliicoccus lentus]HJF22080.1 restriction endonuclease subunit S [Mammaliicoccus lentus]